MNELENRSITIGTNLVGENCPDTAQHAASSTKTVDQYWNLKHKIKQQLLHSKFETKKKQEKTPKFRANI